MFTAIVLLAASIGSTTPNASNDEIWGAALAKCSVWNERPQSPPTWKRIINISWVGGYLSAMSASRYATRNSTDPRVTKYFQSVAGETLISMTAKIDKYCILKPNNTVMDAVLGVGLP